MNLDIDYFKRKLKEITDWYENTAWNKKTLLEKILELETEINKTRDKENLIDWEKLTHTEEKIVSDMVHLRNKMKLSHKEKFDSYYKVK
jgi:putative bdrM